MMCGFCHHQESVHLYGGCADCATLMESPRPSDSLGGPWPPIYIDCITFIRMSEVWNQERGN